MDKVGKICFSTLFILYKLLIIITIKNILKKVYFFVARNKILCTFAITKHGGLFV